MPSPVRKTASRYALAAENDQLRNLLKAAGVELDKDYAGMSLMERENTNMRKQLYAKKNKRKWTYTTGKARLMTSEEMTQALLDELHKKQMSELHSELRKNVFPGIKKAIGDAEKAEKERAKKAVQAAKTAAKRVEQAAKAATKAAEKARKAVEREAARAAKAAGRARGRGRGRARAARGRAGVVGGGRGRGRGQDSSEEEESNAESDSPDEETDLDDPVVGANSGPATTDTESSDEETDLDDPAVSVNPSPSTVNAPLATQDVSDDDNDSDQEETGIASFNGHRWESRRNLEFQVVWTDGDVTWEPFSNVNDCLAMEEYLAHRDVDDPLLLPKRKFLIKVGLRASNE
ncbi:hypothetical protein B0H13DRAFT_2100160 [Mycena leptocephala]|nr:hypothetical protein B0H13DRAFT_2100160 [Mycena leptocephala]